MTTNRQKEKRKQNKKHKDKYDKIYGEGAWVMGNTGEI